MRKKISKTPKGVSNAAEDGHKPVECRVDTKSHFIAQRAERKKNMAISAVKQYNNLMFDLCREHNSIGTSLSENTENWNLRDMVSEVQYTLDTYEDPSCIYWEEAHDDCQPADRPWYTEWVNKKERMKRFINKYKDEALKMECTEGHCSEYD